MLRSKLVPIVMLLVAGGAVAFNWNYYSDMLGGGSSVPPAMTPEHLQVPETPAGGEGGGTPSPADAASVPEPGRDPAAGNPGSGTQEPPVPPPLEAGMAARLGAPQAAGAGTRTEAGPAPVAGTAGTQSAPEPARTSTLAPVMERLMALVGHAAVERQPQPRRVTPFHSESEAISGMTLEKLLAEAQTIRNNRRKGDDGEEGGQPKSAPKAAEAPAPPPPPAAAPGAAIESAMLTCILRGKGYGLCVLGGRRLRTGDAWPGTSFKVTDITDREVVLSDGSLMIRKELAALSTGRGAVPASPAPSEPGNENEGGS